MVLRIVITHDDSKLVGELNTYLSNAGHSVVTLADPVAAIDALRNPFPARLLISRVDFGAGRPHGVALARMALVRCPHIRILFVARPEFEAQVEGLGEFIPMPAKVETVIAAAERLLMRK